MKEKFTPGEWKAVINEPLEDDHICDVYDLNNNCICECFSCGYWGNKKGISEAQKEANMHLIATAPKMYQRLKSVKTDLWALSVNPAISAQTKECIDIIIKNIEGDLKKARGEE